MPVIYVAKSKGLETWGADVGLTKHVYKLGVAPDSAEAAVAALNETGLAGHRDWKLVKKKEIDAGDAAAAEAEALGRLARRAQLVDPNYYPGLKGAAGIVKVRPADIERSVLVAQATSGEVMKAVKINAASIADYLIKNALA